MDRTNNKNIITPPKTSNVIRSVFNYERTMGPLQGDPRTRRAGQSTTSAARRKESPSPFVIETLDLSDSESSTTESTPNLFATAAKIQASLAREQQLMHFHNLNRQIQTYQPEGGNAMINPVGGVILNNLKTVRNFIDASTPNGITTVGSLQASASGYSSNRLGLHLNQIQKTVGSIARNRVSRIPSEKVEAKDRGSIARDTISRLRLSFEKVGANDFGSSTARYSDRFARSSLDEGRERCGTTAPLSESLLDKELDEYMAEARRLKEKRKNILNFQRQRVQNIGAAPSDQANGSMDTSE